MKQRSRLSTWIVVTVAVLAIGTASGWAAATVLTPASDPLEATSFTYVEVAPGEVGSSLQLNVAAQWTPATVGTNAASGVVTAVVVSPGDQVTQGSVLYRVDELPVVVAEGAVPAYRDIGEGSKGADVQQLQEMLIALGHLAGSADGVAGAATADAIRSWQRSLGVEATGSAALGSVIFVPELPLRVALDGEKIARGLTVSGGEGAVRGLPSAPVFRLPVTDAQAGMIPAGTRVEITSPDGDTWVAKAGEQKPDEQSGTIDIALDGPDGAICADACAQVPVAGEVLLNARIVTVESVAGSVVPSAALITTADGGTAVVDRQGERIDVMVVASARGLSVIEGVPDGTAVRVPAEASDTPEGAP